MKFSSSSSSRTTMFALICSMLILALSPSAIAQRYSESGSDIFTHDNEDSVHQLQVQQEAYRQEMQADVATIYSELRTVIECYRQITVELEIDTIVGIGQALETADSTLAFVEPTFSIVEGILSGFEFEVGDDTVSIGGIPVIKDIIKNVKTNIIDWANVACEAGNAIANNCDQRNPVDNFPNAEYGCWRECRMPFELTRVWVNLVALSRLVENTVDKGGKQTIVAVGGGNVSLIVAPISVVVAFTRLVADNVNACDANIQGSEIAASYLRLAALREDHIYSDSVFNVYRIFDLRNRIEINLAGHGNHPHPIATFQLPEAYGGYLELAAAITKETIINMVLAGQNVGNAEHFYQKAEEEYGVGNYKVAYANYGLAYRAATRPIGDNDGH